MNTTALTKTLSNGKVAEVQIARYLEGMYIPKLYLDGAYITNSLTKLPTPQGDRTHVMVNTHKQIVVGFTAAEVATIEAAIEAAKATWRAEHQAEIAAEAKITQRAALVAEYQSLIEEQELAYSRAHRISDPNAMTIRLSYDAKIAATLQAIKDFDNA